MIIKLTEGVDPIQRRSRLAKVAKKLRSSKEEASSGIEKGIELQSKDSLLNLVSYDPYGGKPIAAIKPQNMFSSNPYGSPTKFYNYNTDSIIDLKGSPLFSKLRNIYSKVLKNQSNQERARNIIDKYTSPHIEDRLWARIGLEQSRRKRLNPSAARKSFSNKWITFNDRDYYHQTLLKNLKNRYYGKKHPNNLFGTK